MNKVLMLKEQVYNYVQRAGPIIPIKVAKHFNSNTIFISAILSELISGKKLLLTKAKIGGSPLYYAPGQEPKLADALREHLKQLPKTALEILEQKKVLRDQDCEPAVRVALREIKDFAKPLEIQVEGNTELFWKFHTLDNEQTKSLINEILEKVYKKEEPTPEQPKIEESKPQTEQEKINEEIKQEFQEPEPVEEKEEFEEQKEEPQQSLLQKEEKETLLEQDKPKPKEKDFEKVIISYLNRNKVSILEKQTIKKNRELNFVVNIPSNVGDLMYFVKAKNKKKINEGELLLAFTEGQNLKLPTLYLTNAETTKKAIKYMETNMKGLLYKKINF